MQKTLAEIAKIVDGKVVGDQNIVITGLSGIKEAQEGTLTFLANPKYITLAKETKASAILIPRHVDVPGKTLIQTDNPSLAFSKIASFFTEEHEHRLTGLHKTAVISKKAKLGNNVAVGPLAIIEDGVTVEDGSTVYGGCFIGYKTRIGKNCLIYPNVTVRERVTIGDNVIIHSGTVVGSDGFGFAQVDGIHEKIPQIGTVVIEDDVEIGANVTIDRARFEKTVIGRGTKIDNLVQIAHNVKTGENCIIVAQTGISGSVTIGKGVVLAGQSGVAGHLQIGEGAVVAAQAGVTKSVPAHTKVSGFPAKPHEEAKRVNAALQRLPLYVKEIQELKKRIEKLEQLLNERPTR